MRNSAFRILNSKFLKNPVSDGGIFVIFAPMKHLSLSAFLLLLAVLAACNSREAREMEDALEQAEAVYGDGSLLIETDTALFIPDLSEASGYFADRNNYGKAALAALYNGYTEKDFDKEAAMLSFKVAEHYGELVHDSLTVARAECWIGKMLFDEGRYEDALLTFKVSSNRIGKHYAEKAVIENCLAVAYMLLNQFDSASYHLQNSLDHAQSCHSEKLERKTLNNFAVLYRVQGDYDQSLNCIRTTMANPHLDDVEITLAYLNLGKIFLAKGALDSAAFYYQILENRIPNVQLKNETILSAYDALLLFAEKQGNDSLALLYREKHEDALYDVMSHRQEQTIYRIQRQYDYEALRNNLNRKIIQRHRIIILSNLLLLVLAIIILILQYRHKQMLKAEVEMKRQLNSLKENLRQSVKSSVLDKVVVSQLETIIIANRIKSKAKDPKNEWLPLFLEVMHGKENTFEAAQALIEAAYPNLFSVILEKHPNLNETEAKICMLSCFDLSNSEMGELLGLRTNTINQNRSTLRKKLNLKPEKMSEQLYKIKNVFFKEIDFHDIN